MLLGRNFVILNRGGFALPPPPFPVTNRIKGDHTVKNKKLKTYFYISLACYSMLTNHSGLGFVYFGNVLTAGLPTLYIR